MLLSKLEVLAIGLHEMSLILLATGGTIIAISMMGFCVIVGRRQWALQVFCGILLIEAIYQVGLGIVTVIRKVKSESNMDAAWGDLSSSMRDTFETANNCCGFKSTNDRTGCSEERISTTISCSAKLSGRQNNLLMWLAIVIFSMAMLSFVNYLISYRLVQEYKKVKREFKRAQNERVSSKNISNNNNNIKETTVKTASLEDEKSKWKQLHDLFKAPPKPMKRTDPARSDGSSLTYEEIAAKYRK